MFLLSETSGSISIASVATVTGAPVGIVTASFSLAFSVSTGIVEKKNRNKKYNTI